MSKANSLRVALVACIAALDSDIYRYENKHDQASGAPIPKDYGKKRKKKKRFKQNK